MSNGDPLCPLRLPQPWLRQAHRHRRRSCSPGCHHRPWHPFYFRRPCQLLTWTRRARCLRQRYTFPRGRSLRPAPGLNRRVRVQPLIFRPQTSDCSSVRSSPRRRGFPRRPRGHQLRRHRLRRQSFRRRCCGPTRSQLLAPAPNMPTAARAQPYPLLHRPTARRNAHLKDGRAVAAASGLETEAKEDAEHLVRSTSPALLHRAGLRLCDSAVRQLRRWKLSRPGRTN